MRIGVWHDLPTGGGRRAFEDHLAGLSARGHQIVAFWPRRRDEPELALPAGTRGRALPMRALSGRRTWAPLPPAPVVLDRRAAMSRHLRRAAEQLATADVDVVFVGASRLVRTPDLPRRLSVPSVLYLGEPYRWLYEASPELPWGPRPHRWRSAIDRAAWSSMVRAETRAARSYATVLVNSRFSREALIRAYGIEASICYLGVDLLRFKAAPWPRDMHQVVSVGALLPEKRPIAVIDAIALTATRPRLLWIGNTSDRAYKATVVEHARTRGVDLVLRERVTDDELVHELGRSAAHVYAPRLEPFGLAVLEAAACATPTIGIAEGGVRESVIDGITGVLADDVPGMAVALDRVLQDSALASRLGTAARLNVVEHWSAELGVDRLERHLQRAHG